MGTNVETINNIKYKKIINLPLISSDIPSEVQNIRLLYPQLDRYCFGKCICNGDENSGETFVCSRCKTLLHDKCFNIESDNTAQYTCLSCQHDICKIHCRLAEENLKKLTEEFNIVHNSFDEFSKLVESLCPSIDNFDLTPEAIDKIIELVGDLCAKNDKSSNNIYNETMMIRNVYQKEIV